MQSPQVQAMTDAADELDKTYAGDDAHVFKSSELENPLWVDRHKAAYDQARRDGRLVDDRGEERTRARHETVVRHREEQAAGREYIPIGTHVPIRDGDKTYTGRITGVIGNGEFRRYTVAYQDPGRGVREDIFTAREVAKDLPV